MIELCLDTSQKTTVAVVVDGQTVARAHNDSTRDHAESVMPLVRQALADAGITGPLRQAGIDRVCVGTGPAPFTGLRAGLVSARVMARVVDAPVYGVSSLDIMARQALDQLDPSVQVVVISDARRKELYWELAQSLGPDDVTVLEGPDVDYASRVANHLSRTQALLVSGGAIPEHSTPALSGAVHGPVAPLDPAVMSRIVSACLAAGDEDRLGTQPLYLRRPDIQGEAPQRL